MSFVTISQAGAAFVDAVLNHDQAALAAQEAELARRVRQEVGKLRAEAEAQGRQAGLEAARLTARAEQAALEQAKAALGEAAAQLAAPLAQKEQALADLAVELGFTLARHIIGVEVAANPAGLRALVTKLLGEAAAERTAGQAVTVRVNPADAAHLAGLVPETLGALRTDQAVAAGGALVELAAADEAPAMLWDGTLPTRLNAAREALGLPESVLEDAAR